MNLVDQEDKVTSQPFAVLFGILLLPCLVWYVYSVFSAVREATLFLSNETFLIGLLLILSTVYMAVINLNLLSGNRRSSGYLLHPLVHVTCGIVLIVLPCLGIYKQIETNRLEVHSLFFVATFIAGIPMVLKYTRKFLEIYQGELNET